MIRKKQNQGISLIELLLYCAILSTTLVVIFELFAQASLDRLSSLNESAINLNSQRILSDLGQTIRQADSVESPSQTQSGSVLILNSGAIVYQSDGQGNLIKEENSENNKLNTSDVTVQNLSFQTLGPSTKQPTIQVRFTLKATNLKQGKERFENFQTSISLR